MKIARPYAVPIGNHEVVFDGVSILKRIEYAARVSHRSEERITESSWRKFVENVVINRGDWSVVEHESVSVEFLVDRGITHELVRHRIGSYTQESTRFVNYEKNMPPSFIYPKQWIYPSEIDQDWVESMTILEEKYKVLLKKGWTPQEARSVFPNALASKIIITYNLRNWRHFFIMRTTREAHPQMREVTIPLLNLFQEGIPLLYNDIVPMESQIDALKKAR